MIRHLESTRVHSSVGRALEWHSRGQEFKSPWIHYRKLNIYNGVVAQLWLERQSVTLEAASSSLVNPALFNYNI